MPKKKNNVKYNIHFFTFSLYWRAVKGNDFHAILKESILYKFLGLY